MDKSRKEKGLIMFTLFTLLFVVGGATYAFFQAQKGTGGSANIEISSGTTDSLTFNNGDAILINANQDNFKSGDENITDDTTVTATLTPNNNTKEATEYYNIYLVIEANELEYTTSELKPELILKVTDPNQTMLTEMSGFTYVKDQGFDITNVKHGAYPIKLKQKITAENVAKIDEWQIEVTLVNLGSNQNGNAGKSFKGSILITPQDVETYDLAKIKKITSTTTYKSISTSLEIEEGTNTIDTYYFAIEETDEAPQVINTLSLSEAMSYSFHESKEASYEFTTTDDGKPLKENQNYKIYSYAKDTEGYQSNIYETIITTDKYKIPEVNVSIEKDYEKIKVVATGTSHDGNINKYYFQLDSNEPIEVDGTDKVEYTFDGLKSNSNYTINVKVKDENERYSNPYTEIVKTKPYFHEEENNQTLAQVVSKKQDGVNLIFHDGKIDVNNDGVIDDAGDLAYRYSGNNPDNFVCFGSDASPCPYTNLYRILGVYPFDVNGNIEYRVKLIKSEYITEDELGLVKFKVHAICIDAYCLAGIAPRIHKADEADYFQWIGTNKNNNWNNSQIKLKLNDKNTGYLRNLELKWQNLIDNTTWIIGGAIGSSVQKSKDLYDIELGKNKIKMGDENKCVDNDGNYITCTQDLLTTNAEIGLMYASDYYFAIKSELWASPLDLANIEAKKSNWLYNGFYEFTITRDYTANNKVIHIDNRGYVGSWPQESVNSQSVRPTFYLKASTLYKEGIGTEESPYRLNV